MTQDEAIKLAIAALSNVEFQTPKHPTAITWENGTQIINTVQNVLCPHTKFIIETLEWFDALADNLSSLREQPTAVRLSEYAKGYGDGLNKAIDMAIKLIPVQDADPSNQGRTGGANLPTGASFSAT